MKDGPVETFLADLEHHLRRSGDVRSRAVAEIREHLRELVVEGRAQGFDERAAETAAVARFGSARALARGLRLPRRRSRSIAAAIAVAAAGTCAVALIVSVGRSPERPGTRTAATALRPAPDPPPTCVASARTSATRDEQGLVGIDVEIDPRTGAVLACDPRYSIPVATRPPLVVAASRSPFG